MTPFTVDTTPMPFPPILLFLALVIVANVSLLWAIPTAYGNRWTKTQIRWYVAGFAAADLIGLVGFFASLTGAPLLGGVSAVTAWTFAHPTTTAIIVGIPVVVVATTAATTHGGFYLPHMDEPDPLTGQ